MAKVHLPFATINVDGNEADWQQIPPSVNSSPGCRNGPCPLGADLKSLRLAQNGHTLYFLMEVWEGQVITNGTIRYRRFDNNKNGVVDCDPADRQVSVEYNTVTHSFFVKCRGLSCTNANVLAPCQGLAAGKGGMAAQRFIGWCYAQGEGVSQDYAEAVTWYRKAANQGDAPSQNNLEQLYQHGYGVAQDYIEAYSWYNLAAANGETKAAENRDLIAFSMTPSQIAEGQRLAREFKKSNTEQ